MKEGRIAVSKEYFWLILLSLLLVFLDLTVDLSVFKTGLQRILLPVQQGMLVGGAKVRSGMDFFWEMPGVYKENHRLRHELVDHQQLVAQNYQLKKENESLRNQLSTRVAQRVELNPARVLGFSRGGGKESLIIEGGHTTGQPVVWHDFLVGSITESRDARSSVRTIFSPDSQIVAQVIPSAVADDLGADQDVAGVVEGHFANKLVLKEVLKKNDISSDDLVVTSGAAGLFPQGLVIGRVAKVWESEGGVYKEADISVDWKLNQLSTVYVFD